MNLYGWSNLSRYEDNFHNKLSYKTLLSSDISKKEYLEYMNLIRPNQEVDITKGKKNKKKAHKIQFNMKRYRILIEKKI